MESEHSPEEASGPERRRRDLKAALASVALEGLTVPDSYQVEGERYVAGEIDFDTLTSKVHELARAR